jgi:fumarylacetoacetase
MVGAENEGSGIQSWVPVPEGSDFPIVNLPYGVIRRADGATSIAVAIGDHVLDLGIVQRAGLLGAVPALPPDAMSRSSLNGLMAAGPVTWRATRRAVTELLRADRRVSTSERVVLEAALLRRDDVELLLPFEVADYVDFYSSLHHARNVGRILRPGEEPLPPNWRSLPMAYHGRAGTVVVGGCVVPRPHGQYAADDGTPRFLPSRMVDFELEVGFVIGTGSARGAPIETSQAANHVFGLVLVNDWSARDIQAFEYRPLGPFLGKSFATSISPWVVTLDAIQPFVGPSQAQDPPVAPYLRCDEPWRLDVTLEVAIASRAMCERGHAPHVVCTTSAANLYWTIPQQLAHATVNGASTRTGDLFASGTVSGPERGSWGSLLELTWGGTRAIELPTGEQRAFLEDGDTVVMRGRCEANDRIRIGFGELVGTIGAAPSAAGASVD